MGRLHRPTILIAEDDPAVRKLIRAVLRDEGYCVLAAGNGEQALALFHASASMIDLAIIDIQMPRISGLDLAGRLAPQRGALRILYISGLAHSVAVESLTHSSPALILPKPFTAAELLDRIRALLASEAGSLPATA